MCRDGPHWGGGCVAELDLAASDDTFMENNIEGAIVYTVK